MVIGELDPGVRELPVAALPAGSLGERVLQPTEGGTLVNQLQPKPTLLARHRAGEQTLQPLQKVPRIRLGRNQPRNRAQTFALDLLLDPAVPLLTLAGKPGTGKTLLALAAGLHQVDDDHLYERLLVTRAVIPVDKDIGSLPGDLNETMGPWMPPIVDNVDDLPGASSDDPAASRGRGGRAQRSNWADRKGMGLLELEAFSSINGRSIQRQFMVVDGAQNLTPLEVTTIVTRVGEATKIVLTGDP